MLWFIVKQNFTPLTFLTGSLFRWTSFRGISKQGFTMNTAYFRHVNGENAFHVTFRYVNKEIGIDKQFNFCRQITENSAAFLGRINTNIEKVVERKKKSKAKKLKENPTKIQSEISKVEAVLLCNECPVDSEFPCVEIFNSSSAYALDILSCRLPVEINAPWVETIALPKGIMAGFMVYPSKFESFFVDPDSSNWTWFRSVGKTGPWKECGTGAKYETSCADVGHYLRVVCEPRSKSGRIGPLAEAVSPEVVEAGPGILPLESRHKFTTSKLDEKGLRIVSYNILADLYVDSEYSKTILFGYCPTYALELTYRRQLLLKELLGYHADLICMQEVDSKVFRHDLEPVLNSVGLLGEFSQKGETVSEGTATFYDKHKFRCLQNWRVVLGEALQTDPLFADFWKRIQTNEALISRITERSTTLQVLLLESLTVQRRLLLVANVHLYFHPDADHIRLLQAVLIISYLESILKNCKQEYPECEISLVWCGDFNSIPECGIYQLVTTGSVQEDHSDWRSNKAEAVSDIKFTHPLKLASACGTPEYTNYTVGFKACLDYIFYETPGLEVEQVVPLPSEEELSQHLAIPSVVFPSDHLALVADFRWKSS